MVGPHPGRADDVVWFGHDLARRGVNIILMSNEICQRLSIRRTKSTIELANQ